MDINNDNLTLEDKMALHQFEAEWMFCAAVFAAPDMTIPTVKWLSPDKLRNNQLRQFWQDVLNGVSSPKAATDAGIFFKLAGYSTRNYFHVYDADTYAKIIIDDSWLIEVTRNLNKIGQAISERNIKDLPGLVDSLAAIRRATGRIIPVASDVACEFMSAIDDDDRLIRSYITPLDDAIGGFERQTLTLIAARPSMGKTSLAFQIACTVAAMGKRAIYFSPEMSGISLWARRACGLIGISWTDVISKHITPEQRQALIDISGELVTKYNDRLWIDDRSHLTTQDIWQATADLKPDLVVVDHIGLIADPTERLVERLGKISWGGKQIAKENDIPIIYLQQLSRKTEEGGGGRRPTLADLRDSGELEQNADNVIFLYREDYYDLTKSKKNSSETELIIGKFRNGTRNQQVIVDYDLAKQWFYRKGVEHE